MGIQSATGSMTIDEFYAHVDADPRDGKWELIGGEPVLNAAPSDTHAQIVCNVSALLWNHQRLTKTRWTGLPGIGVRVSEHELLEPDFAVVPAKMLGTRERNDAIVVFEVLSPSTKNKDLGPKREAYTGLPSVTHYVVIAQDTIEVRVYARESDFDERLLKSRNDVLYLPSIGAELPLTEIYWGTGL